jgi:ferredoxin
MGSVVILDKDECIGCESCVEVCPDVFEFDESSELANLKDVDADAFHDCIEEAIEVCPVDCIYWR